MKKLKNLQASAVAAGEDPNQAIQAAIQSGALKVELRAYPSVRQLPPETVGGSLRELFANHVEPASPITARGPVGFAAHTTDSAGPDLALGA